MIRTSLIVVALGWSSVVAAQPDPGGAPAPMEEVQPAPPPGGSAAAVMAPPPLEVEAPRKVQKISVTWAPILLIVPLVELTVEYRVMAKLGVSLTLGAGKRTLEDVNGTFIASGPEYEGGLQVRYYVLGSFRHGMQLGVQALEEYINLTKIAPNYAVAAGGFTVGGFLGYKIATRVGFTFEAQLGARYLVIEPEFQGAAGGPTTIPKQWAPLLHLNIGWSF